MLIRALAPSKVLGRRPAEIRSLVCDARRVEAGALFVCVPSVLFAAFFVITANRLVDIAYAAPRPAGPLRLKAERPAPSPRLILALLH